LRKKRLNKDENWISDLWYHTQSHQHLNCVCNLESVNETLKEKHNVLHNVVIMTEKDSRNTTMRLNICRSAWLCDCVIMSEMYLSSPAVSHSWSLYNLLSIDITLEKKSIPIVALASVVWISRVLLTKQTKFGQVLDMHHQKCHK
jgi:hypothetical protein